ncbi:PEP-CTERM sorting domain-containing protein [Methyloglobulus sp.]|uniref:PEP-CTERM sorting domain-containing protein n=1 Tax=Methyloglobulus sp. TaxID=2518622 RepID=UPI0032B7782E
MKIRFCLLIVVLLSGFVTGAYAATKKSDSTSAHHETSAKSDDKKSSDNEKIVEFDVKNELEDLIKGDHEEHNIYLQMSKNDNDDEHKYEHHEDKNGSDVHVDAVPVPAALWLFGSGLLGLFGVKRKST